MTRSGRTPKGWYPDPDLPERQRWFDGTGWTGWLSADPDAPAPQQPGPHVVPRRRRGHPVVRVAVVTDCLLLAVVLAMTIGGTIANRRAPGVEGLAGFPTPGPASTLPTQEFMPRLQGDVLDLVGATISMPGAPYTKPGRVNHDTREVFDGYALSLIPNSKTDRTGLTTAVIVGWLQGSPQPAEATIAAGTSGLTLSTAMYAKRKDASSRVARSVPDRRWGADRPAATATIETTFTAGGARQRGTVEFTVVQLPTGRWMAVVVTGDLAGPGPRQAREKSLASLRFS